MDFAMILGGSNNPVVVADLERIHLDSYVACTMELELPCLCRNVFQYEDLSRCELYYNGSYSTVY